MQPSFIHLHLHTEYSLSDGLIQIDTLMQQAAQLGMPALALTDQNNLFAAVKFYQKALQHGIKPILGSDIYLFNPKQPRTPFRITCLCQNERGLKNLFALLSNGFLKG